VAKARVEWREQQPKLTASKLVFIDESSVKTNMTRRLAGPNVANVWSLACHMGIGKRPPSSARCVATV
jgi:hypothetical protein